MKSKLKFYTKATAKFGTIIIVGFLLILASIFIKYKPAYGVTIAGEKLGDITDINEFKEKIEEQILNKKGENISDVSLDEDLEYTPKLVTRTSKTNDDEIIQTIENNYTTTTYKFFEVSLNDETKEYVNTIEEAEQIVEKIKQEFNAEELDLDLKITEKYTFNTTEINTDTLEVASSVVESKAQEIKEENEAIAIIDGIKLSVLPVSGKITSRYGESSSLRRSTHTGLDIACATGTNIKVVSSGTVTFAASSGSYGNLVKVDHGNGIETWYGHCSKIYAKVGQKVEAGDIISAVGSTGNSTGPHLHFEIRINGNTVNPQQYIY